ncbi:vesicular acetylcholine transporter-like [Tropilaelaps mercedesae]|uniref:Vesicular acetylcholine transporter-like n=1 Tax=Tropilaelaps mercedesae TaxID=418985 RepID=A0A1V9XMQ5_9ACAR|nr:vesicular acetylcholine transporter-like [Tropilaelaps mercedesae]
MPVPAIPIPVLNTDTATLWNRFMAKAEDPVKQKKLILIIVCIALLLDNMLYMVIVPIIPQYLRDIGSWQTHQEGGNMSVVTINTTGRIERLWMRVGGRVVYEGEESAVGVLFASKAMVQLLINPFSGAVIDRIGYDLPMMFGLTIMFLSTAIFACGQSYGVLFFARSLQGVGSAFADTGGLAMIADRFTEEAERSRALGIALAFISFGCLVAPPFGGLLFEFAGKEVPFVILSLVCLVDGILLLFVMRPVKQQMKDLGMERPKGTPIHVLLMDPFIAVCAGALMMSNVSLAFLEPTIAIWMKDNLHTEDWQVGLVWLPAFIPHVLGVYITVIAAERYPQYQWAMAAFGLALEGISSFVVPFAKSYWFLFFPLSGICFGIAMVDTSLLPTLGFLVDYRYVSVYGSIYAIADISYSMAYAIGPVIAGGIVESIGFTPLNIFIAITNIAYVPLLWRLKNVYNTKEGENLAMTEAPAGKRQQDYRACEGVDNHHHNLRQEKLEQNTSFAVDELGHHHQQQQQQQQQQASYRSADQAQQQIAAPTWDDDPWGDASAKTTIRVKGPGFAFDSD